MISYAATMSRKAFVARNTSIFVNTLAPYLLISAARISIEALNIIAKASLVISKVSLVITKDENQLGINTVLAVISH